MKEVANPFEDKISIFVPIDAEDSIRKSDEMAIDSAGNELEEATKSWYVRGYASTPDLDKQNDIVVPNGIDISYFLQKGNINYEHEQDESYIIGKPTDKCYVDVNKGLFVEAKLFKTNNYAEAMFNLARNMAKSGSTQRLGFSIEGKVGARDAIDTRKIRQVTITNVALTTNPANPEATWEALAKNMQKAAMTGHEINSENMTGAAAFRAETLSRDIKHMTYRLKEVFQTGESDKIWKEVGAYMDATKSNNFDNAVVFLQLAKGLSRKDAQDMAKSFMSDSE